MLPIYEVLLTDEVKGMYALSFVENPAMNVHMLAFSKDEATLKCSVINEEERKILCVICRCDYPFYRKFPDVGDCYVVYHKETIEKMAQRLLSEGNCNAINIEHRADSYVDGVKLEQLFIKDGSKGINPAGFEEIEEGSLFGIYRIENEALWQHIKAGDFGGVSLEGVFTFGNRTNDTITNVKDLLKMLK